MLWSNQLTQDQLIHLRQKGALQLNHFYKKFTRGKAGHWQQLKYTRLFLDQENQYELYLVGDERGGDEEGVYFLKSSTLAFFHNGRLSYGAFIHAGDRIVIGQEIFQFLKDASTSPIIEYLTEPMIYSDATVLITGDTGTGKGHLAKKIYDLRKHQRPWVHVNIAALAPSLIESEIFGHIKGAFTGAHQENVGALKAADFSVLFLDEIDSLPLELQSKLLVFLDEYRFKPVGSQKEIQVKLKLIVASGQPLEHLVQEGKFRKDLYYRLMSGFSLSLPALKNHPQLVEDFCHEYAKKNQIIIEPLLMDFYKKQMWPGNYRQLKSHLDRKKHLSLDSKHFYFTEDDQGLMSLYLDNSKNKNFHNFPDMNQQRKSYANLVYQQMMGDLTLTAATLKISMKTLKALLI